VETTGVFDRPNVLLIDDCAAQRDLYEFALAHEFNILTAARGAEGASLAARERPDAIVLDVLMPGMDGWETCTHIKSNARTAHIPVILLTGTNDRDLSQHAMAVGATAILRKPCPADQLRDVILAAMTGSPADRQHPRSGPSKTSSAIAESDVR
jgi:CheY-like chemotaxis protein